MRLERVIAKDSRRATEEVIATYGPDALIISNQRVNGMTEIVVAVETEDAPKTAVGTRNADSPSSIRPVTRKTDAFGRTLLSSMETERPASKQTSSRAGASPVASPSEAAEEPKHVPPFLRGVPLVAGTDNESEAAATPVRASEPAEPAGQVDIMQAEEPRRSPDSDHTTLTASARATATAAVKPASVDIHADDADEAESPIDSARARELVDLVRAELASMRQEIALSRHVDAYQPGGALPAELQPLAGALASASVPVALRTLLLDQARECADLESAVDSMKLHLAASITSLEQADRFEGVHVFAGPTGAGKTQMLFRLASRHIAQFGAGSVAVLSFADTRIGAWTQIQMLGARLGVDCFRVTGEELLGPMLDELQPRKLILIDTPGSGFSERLSSIQRCAPRARFNLVVPADVSGSSLARFVPHPSVSWHSVMVSKLDEPAHLWPLIQALCNHSVPLSLSSASGAAESSASVLTSADIVRSAFDSLELPVKATVKVRAVRKPAPRTRRDTRHAA